MPRGRPRNPLRLEFWLAVYRCPNHPDFLSIHLDETENGEDSTGTRLTPGKCCGRWDRVTRWRLTETMAEAAVEELTVALEEIRAQDA